MLGRCLVAFTVVFASTSPALTQRLPGFPKKVALKAHTRHKDVIYHRKDGVALTMDVFAPKEKPNGAGVIVCISAEYRSSKEMLDGMVDYATGVFLNRGYVVFMVCHGSQPRYTVPEIETDIHRAVRFVKANAKEYQVDPKRLGITGASSGGQLSLMMGCACKDGNPKSVDPVERESSRVAAVACIFPVADFRPFDKNPPDGFKPDELFPFRELDEKTKQYSLVTPERRFAIGETCSPLLCVSKDSAPTLVIHGIEDKLVPIKQSRDLAAAFQKCGAKCDLLQVKGMGHSVHEALPHVPKLADWFDKHLSEK
jgi:acetyl esterase/lipase